MKKLHLIAINEPGLNAARNLRKKLRTDTGEESLRLQIHTKPSRPEREPSDSILHYGDLDSLLKELWSPENALLFFLATGIVVRKIAPLLRSKYEDPAVLVMDFGLKHILPLLSGHAGGANEIAQQIASRIPECEIFLSTATDQQNLFAVDLFAKKNDFRIENSEFVAKVSNALLNGAVVPFFAPTALFDLIRSFPGYSESQMPLRDLMAVHSIGPSNSDSGESGPSVLLSPGGSSQKNSLRIRIRPISIGCGLNRGTSAEELEDAFMKFLEEQKLDARDIDRIASFIAKENEPGLLEFSRKRGLSLSFFREDEINNLPGLFSDSQATRYFGIKGVAEPCAVLASMKGWLFVRKHVYGNVTLAAAF